MESGTEQMYRLMKKESNRLKTFQMFPPWPKDYVDIKKLAKAGFFYAFVGDNVHCAFCRGQVSRWDRDDDPMAEHSRHFSTCPFIMGGEVGNEPIGEDPFPGPKRPRPYDVCGPYPNFPPNDPRYERERQTEQAHADPNDHPHDQLPQDNQQPAAATIPDPQLVTNNQFAAQQTNHQRPLMAQQQPPTSLQVPPIEIQRDQQNQIRNNLIYQHMRNQEYIFQQQQIYSSNNNNVGNQNQSSEPSSNSLNGICKICYTNPIELVFLPCGHSVSCLSCAHRLHDCPFCRETITTRIRTYLV